MKNARALLRELEVWKVAWQQVEAFLEQIDGAQDKDGAERRKLDGLLHLARAVERHRAAADPGQALGDPVITRLPPRAYEPASDSTTSVTGSAGWDEALRVWRLPGADEVELAVGLLQVDDDGDVQEAVDLPRIRTLFQQRDASGALTTLRLPSYPGTGGVTIVEAPLLRPTIAEGDVGSLFTRDERREATLGLAPGSDEPLTGDEEDVPSPVRAWSSLAAARRGAARPTSGSDVVRLSSDRGADGPPWGDVPPGVTVLVVSSIDSVLATPAPSPAASASLRSLASDALAAARWLADDVAAAKTASDDEGYADPDLTAAIDAAAAAAVGPRDALASVVAAVDRLAQGSVSARADLRAARDVLARPVPLPAAIFGHPPEDAASPLSRELDTVVAARVEYPDGTLRSLRTLETGFAAVWPGLRRWFVLRHGAVLAPAFRTFLGPFVEGLGALLRGGFTGLPCEGLTLATATPVGAQQVDLGQPGSFVPTLVDVLEPGHLGVIGGDRPAPVVVLGVVPRLGQASLHTAPLRLSLAPGPGAGTAPGGAVIDCRVARGLTARELRRGRADAGPAHDAPPREALALYSSLALLLGTDGVERLLQGLGPSAPVRTRLVPSAALPASLAGTVPAHATTLVVHGLGATFWAAPGHDGVPADSPLPEPRLLRPGELVLLRGRALGDGGEPGALVQAPVEVDDVVAVAGRVLDRMDTTRAAVLSTDPAALPPPDAATAEPPRLVCGPDEPLTVVLLKRSWAREPLLADVSLSRAFRGFDVPSLAARTLLPLDLVQRILGAAPPDEPGVGRAAELAAALDILDSWTRHGR
jgi:hypothetical protein